MLLPFQCLQRYAKTNRNTLQRFDRNNCRQYYSHHVPSAHKQPISHDDIINAERIPWRKCETVSCWRTVEFSCEQFSRTVNQNIRSEQTRIFVFLHTNCIKLSSSYLARSKKNCSMGHNNVDVFCIAITHVEYIVGFVEYSRLTYVICY